MCLAVPGKIVKISQSDDQALAGPVATVEFQGTQLEVSLSMTPQAAPGDWVLVHAGFALNVLDEQEALETWQFLKQAGVQLGIEEPTP